MDHWIQILQKKKKEKKEKEIHLLRNLYNSTVFFPRVAAKGILALTSSWSHRQKVLLKTNKSMAKTISFSPSVQYINASSLEIGSVGDVNNRGCGVR